jgi:AsmA protein
MKTVKYLLYALGGLVVLALVAIAIFVKTFDPNRYKGEIEQAVKERTGRTLKLQGDLKVAIFPSLGADVAGVSLSERASDQQFLSLDSAHASVAVMPLLRGEVVVDKVNVSGLKANVVKGKDGKFNFDDLLQSQEAQKPAAPAKDGAEKSKGKVQFNIAGVNIDRSSVSYRDLGSGREISLADLKLSTGRIAEKADGKLELATAAKGNNPALDLRINLKGDYRVDLPAKAYALSKVDGTVKGTLDKDALDARLTAPKIDIAADKASGEAVVFDFSLKGPQRTIQANLKIAGVQGSAKALSIPSLTAELAMSGSDMPRAFKVPLSGSVQADLDKQTASADLTSRFDESNIKAKLGLAKFSPPAYTFDLNVDKLNLDQYFPPKPKAAPASAPAGKDAGKGEAAKQEDSPVDLSALKDLNANGKLQFGALQAKGLKLANLKAEIRAANGRLDVSPHSANLYDGSLSGALSVQAAGNRITLKESMSNVSVGPLLRDVAQQDRLEGRGNVTLDVNGGGATVNTIKRSLDGTAKVNLRDGAIKGIDIGALLNKVKSLGGKSEEGSASGKDETKFTELNASFAIKNGVAHNQDLDVKAPLIRVTGAGDIDIGSSSLDYVAKAAVVATTKGQGGAGLEQLSGITVPVKLSGPFDAMKYKVDYGAVAGDLAKSKVGEKAKEAIEKNKDKVGEQVRDRLKGLLGR